MAVAPPLAVLVAVVAGALSQAHPACLATQEAQGAASTAATEVPAATQPILLGRCLAAAEAAVAQEGRLPEAEERAPLSGKASPLLFFRFPAQARVAVEPDQAEAQAQADRGVQVDLRDLVVQAGLPGQGQRVPPP